MLIRNDKLKPRVLARVRASIQQRGILSFLAHVLMDIGIHCIKTAQKYRDYRGSTIIRGQVLSSESVIIVLAGYKPALWPLTLSRIARFAPRNVAVCIVSPGKYAPNLAALCERNGWCYLSLRQNKTGLALNKAVALYPDARWVYKLDEDIFVADGFFDELRRGYEEVVAQGIYRPGFCAPIINVNGVSYLNFLQAIGKEKEYRAKFGTPRIACNGVSAHADPEAARWLWNHSLPFDDLALRFRKRGTSHSYDMIPIRFSIGAILLERDFLREIGGFKSTWRQGILGIDESNICSECILHSRPMILINNVLAGHFSFYTQEAEMLAALPELANKDPSTFSDGIHPYVAYD